MNLTKNMSIRYALAVAGLVVTTGGTALVAGATTDQVDASSGPDPRALAAHAAADAAKEAELARVAASARLQAERESKARAAADAARAARTASVARASRKARAAAAAKAAAKRRPAWVRPMRGDLTSGFGFRWGTTHAGVDIANGGGTPIYAAAAGVVAAAECSSPSCSGPGSLGMSGYGNKVDIAHAGGVVTRYGHMSRYVVRAGQRVTAGQLIGYEGETGNVTGPHLHLEVLIDDEAVNPIPYFARKGVNLRKG